MAEKKVPKKVIDPALELRAINYVKLAFVRVLREAFGHECTPEEYRYRPKKHKEASHIAINRAFKKGAAFYPAIIVKTGPGEAGPTTLGNEELYEEFDDDGNLLGKVVAGQMWFPVTIEIMATTTTDREKLTDLVLIYMRYLFKGFFEANDMPYLQVDGGENGEELVGKDRVYLGRVTTRVQTEFDQFIDQSMFDLIESINLKAVRFGSDTTDLQSNNDPPGDV